MKIFANIDGANEKSLKTKKDLERISGIEVVDDIKNADMVFSIGGDGTFLKTSRLSDKPVFGINTGTLGYLTEINPDGLKSAVDKIVEGNYHIENRMMIEGEIIKDGVLKIPPALNEIAITKKSIGVIRFQTIVNGRIINSYTADGILVCTPTGSTAYNLSCGGPIVDPTAEIITLTPIAPHSVINRSIVISDEAIVQIKITEIRNDESAFVLYDGKPIEIKVGDEITVKKSEKVTKIVKLEDRSFIDTVRENIS